MEGHCKKGRINHWVTELGFSKNELTHKLQILIGNMMINHRIWGSPTSKQTHGWPISIHTLSCFLSGDCFETKWKEEVSEVPEVCVVWFEYTTWTFLISSCKYDYPLFKESFPTSTHGMVPPRFAVCAWKSLSFLISLYTEKGQVTKKSAYAASISTSWNLPSVLAEGTIGAPMGLRSRPIFFRPFLLQEMSIWVPISGNLRS